MSNLDPRENARAVLRQAQTQKNTRTGTVLAPEIVWRERHASRLEHRRGNRVGEHRRKSPAARDHEVAAVAAAPRDTASQVGLTILAGGIAGIVAKTASAPMDRIKIIFQTDSVREFSLRSAAREARRVVGEEGFWSLWRGNSATVVRVFPYAGMQFAAYDQYSRFFSRVFKTGRKGNENEAGHKDSARDIADGGVRSMDGDRLERESARKFLSSRQENGLSAAHLAERMLAGSGAGATAVLATYPLDVLRARMAVQTHTVVYRDLWHAVRRIVYDEGVPALVSGLRPTLIGIIPYAGLAFTGFHSIKAVMQANGIKFEWWHKLLAGGLAGLVAQTLTYPLDVVRRRMQTERFLLDVAKKSARRKVSKIVRDPYDAPPVLAMQLGARRTWRGGGLPPDEIPPEVRYTGIVQAMRTILREEGWTGLFKGVQMNWIKGPIAVGISFTVNDMVLKWLSEWEAREED